MTARYLLDTTVILDHVYGYRPAFILLDRLIDEDARLLTCAVVVSEALAFDDPTHRFVVSRLINTLDYVAIDAGAARAAADARMTHGVGLADALIAATARSIDATVVTRARPAIETQGVPVLTY